jgi:Domain of unknown function (DUF4224)
MFLSPEQLCEMTGYRRYSGQRRWLQREGISFRIRADGRPIVLISELTKTPPPHAQPNFGAMATRGVTRGPKPQI